MYNLIKEWIRKVYLFLLGACLDIVDLDGNNVPDYVDICTERRNFGQQKYEESLVVDRKSYNCDDLNFNKIFH